MTDAHLTMTRRTGRRLLQLLSAVLVLGLSSCYIPDSFLAEFRISKGGGAAIDYNGDLVWIPLALDIADSKVSRDEAAEKSQILLKDLGRDGGFKELKQTGDARFRVSYHREGCMPDPYLYSFVRRNAQIMSVHVKDRILTVRGSQFRPSDAARMMAKGVPMRGEFRVVTDAKVTNHNSRDVRAFGPYTVYVWKIENPLSPSPRLSMEIDPTVCIRENSKP